MASGIQYYETKPKKFVMVKWDPTDPDQIKTVLGFFVGFTSVRFGTGTFAFHAHQDGSLHYYLQHPDHGLLQDVVAPGEYVGIFPDTGLPVAGSEGSLNETASPVEPFLSLDPGQMEFDLGQEYPPFPTISDEEFEEFLSSLEE